MASTWTAATRVSTETLATQSAGDPDIAVDGAGNLHVAWSDASNIYGAGNDPDVFYNMRNLTTGSFGNFGIASFNSGNASFNPSIAVDGAGDVHVVWEELDTDVIYNILYSKRSAATGSWSNSEVVSSWSTSTSQRPTIAVDYAGNVHVAWQDNEDILGAGNDFDIFHNFRNATNGTWSGIQVLSTTTEHSYEPSITLDGDGNPHVTWEENNGSDIDIFYKGWNVGTGAWDATALVSSESTAHSYHSTVAVDGTGNVHVAWQDKTNYLSSGTDFDIFYKLRNESTGTWGTTVVVSSESTADSREPRIDADGAGNMHLAWIDHTDFGGSGPDIDIFYKLYNASTRTWRPTEVVSTGSTTETYKPGIAVDTTGAVHVTWTDSTIRPARSDVCHAQLATSPSAPQAPRAIPATHDIALSWLPPARSGSSPISGYVVYRAATAGGDFEWIGNVVVTTFTDTGLRSGETWHYKVLAINSEGQGPTSSETNATTWRGTEVVSTESMVESEKQSIAVDSAGTAHVIWREATGGIYYRARGSSGSWSASQLVSTASNSDPHEPCGAASADGRVHVAWRDWNDVAGSWNIAYKSRDPSNGVWSAMEWVTNGALAAFTPTIAVDLNGDVHVSWRQTMPGVDNHTIQYRLRNASASTWQSIEIVSTESDGRGVFNPSIAVDGSGNAHLAWEDATDYAGAGGTDMDIFYKRRDAVLDTWSITTLASNGSTAGSHSVSVAAGAGGDVHLAWMDATDILGAGPLLDIFYKAWNATASTWSTTEVVSAESDGFSELPSVAIDNDGNVHVAWFELGTGKFILHSERDPTSNTWTSAAVVSTESTNVTLYPSLALDPASRVHVAWTDASDYGNAGTDIDVFYKCLVPTSPLAPEDLLADEGNRSVALTWTAPGDDGGTPVMRYCVYRSTTSGSGHVWISNSTETNFVDTGLTNGVTYHYVVRAWNVAGEGPASNPASATPASAPTAPRDLQAHRGLGHVNLTWIEPADDGSVPVSSYTIYWSMDCESFTAIDAGNVTLFQHDGLPAGQAFHYKVSAKNAIGNGTNTTVVSTVTCDTPGPVTGLVATAGDGHVSLIWAVPGDDGGLPVATYVIYRSTTSGSGYTWLANTTTTSYTDTSVTNGQYYYYLVMAWNEAGEGTAPAEVIATPTSKSTGMDVAWLILIVAGGGIGAVGAVLGVARVKKKKGKNLKKTTAKSDSTRRE